MSDIVFVGHTTLWTQALEAAEPKKEANCDEFAFRRRLRRYYVIRQNTGSVCIGYGYGRCHPQHYCTCL